MPQFFIDRPVFAWVVALFILLAGALAIPQLPVAQYPDVAPPQIEIYAVYPGASAQTVDESVVSLIEEELNGADHLLYFESQSSLGSATIKATFQPGTNPELAQVDVQNRLKVVESRLPQAVNQQGLQVEKVSAGFLLLMAASMLADGGGFAKVYLGGAAVSPELVSSDAFQTALWTTMLLYVPLSMLFWHAPALVYWQQIEPVKSLFFSWMGCWRNKGAFTVYVAVWAAVFGSAAVTAMLVASLMGDPQMTLSIMMPLALLVAAMFFTSMLFTVKDCFSTGEPQLAQ